MSHAPDCPNFETLYPWQCSCAQHFECADCPVAEPRMCEKVGRCAHRDGPVDLISTTADPVDGYRDAYYQIAKMLGFSAMAMSPAQAWELRVKPHLLALISQQAEIDRAIEILRTGNRLAALPGIGSAACISALDQGIRDAIKVLEECP